MGLTFKLNLLMVTASSTGKATTVDVRATRTSPLRLGYQINRKETGGRERGPPSLIA